MCFNFFGRCRVCVFDFFVVFFVPCLCVFLFCPCALCLVQLYLWWIRARLAGTGARSDGRIENKSDNKSSTFFNNWVNNGKALLWLQCYYWSLFLNKVILGDKVFWGEAKIYFLAKRGTARPLPLPEQTEAILPVDASFALSGYPLAQGKILFFSILNIVNSKIKANLAREGFQKTSPKPKGRGDWKFLEKMLRSTMSPELE